MLIQKMNPKKLFGDEPYQTQLSHVFFEVVKIVFKLLIM